MSKLNIEQMLKIIPEFDGSSKKLDKFLACCEIVYNPLTNKEDQSLFLNVLKSKLGDKPFDIVKYGNFKTWEDLKKEFVVQFSESRPVEQLQVELVQIRQQRNDSVREFASKVEQLLSDLNTACIMREGEPAANYIRNLNSVTALNTFQNGLKEPFRLIVKACRFDKLKDAVAKAIEEEVSIANVVNSNYKTLSYSNYQNFQNNIREKCQLCTRMGHTAKSCYSFTTQNHHNNNFDHSNNLNSTYKVPNTNSYSNSNQHFSNSRQLVPSNISNNFRTVKCNYCKKIGHTINDCRKRKYNNQRTVNLENRNLNPKPENLEQTPGANSSSSVNYMQSNQSNAVVRASVL